jgi:heme-degrading monooxygenase HmoA
MPPLPAATPPPPFYAVIFTSLRDAKPDDGYAETAARMEELAAAQPGFLGIDSARTPDGLGITVSYWASEQAVRDWGRHAEHLLAQRTGRQKWYERFTLRVCRVEHARSFTRDTSSGDPT